MDTQIDLEVRPTNAWLVVMVKDGRLKVNIDLPLRWTLISISAFAAATGYPSIVDVVTKLLRTR